MHEEGVWLYMKLRREVERGAASWGALAAEDHKQIDEVLIFFSNAAQQRHAEAQFSLGSMYAQGEGVAQSGANAIPLFKMVAVKGYAGSLIYLGIMYRGGWLSGSERQGSSQFVSKGG